MNPASGTPAIPTAATTDVPAIFDLLRERQRNPVQPRDEKRGHRFVKNNSVVVQIRSDGGGQARESRGDPALCPEACRVSPEVLPGCFRC